MILFITLVIIFIVSYIIIGKYIDKIKLRYTQPLLKEGPAHEQKYGTPTMGGVAFVAIFTILLLILLIINSIMNIYENNIYILIILVSIIGYALIGFKDDYDKVKYKQNDLGLSPKMKLILQFLVGLIIVILLRIANHSTIIDINFLNLHIDFGYFYFIIVIFLLLATTNATNLTDGLDGLLTTNAIISLVFLSIIAGIEQINILVVSNLIIIVILIAFLLYNKNPAKIFMGDVGSLTIGSILVVNAILLKIEILFFMFSFIYFIETLSVIIQVSYFKYTKKKFGQGKRLFLMAPFHHHLEKKGYNEKKVVIVFASINIVMSCIGLFLYNI